ncbi:Intraflagellar transport protein 88 [Boothiomyces macroporosus]|uniref:Intraflagellar transport protein 88 n=1 Tax=Boothiomyces macroporosus TaxID=261099 RepID=A0AAD5UK93_9FUNG|nr:Intraflagellar transport protein 88 [Boothiomyces macroporosus]
MQTVQTQYGRGETARPMTSVRGAGYSSRGRSGASTSGQSFDPFNQAVDKPGDVPPEEVIKGLEKKVNQLIEDSAFAAEEGKLQLALDKAKDAGKKERQLSKQREQLNIGDQLNLDLTYCVLFNLANQYHANKMYQEALNSYAVIVKNKLFNQSGRLRVNMGNIYFEQGKYSQAIKMYRMALDQISNSNRDFRFKIMRNIGNAFIKMGQFQDAITSFEAIMEGNPDMQTGFNLVLCYFAIGDKDKMKRGFQRLVSIPPPNIEQNDENNRIFKDEPIEDHEVFDEDALRAIAREKKKAAHRYIILAAKLVAPSIEANFSAGYDWMVEVLKASSNNNMASELEIAKSVQYLKTKDFQQALESLKAFEKKDQKLVGTASTNLSFLYFLEGDYKNSEYYADIAIDHDRYNSKAQTNKGQLAKARDHYQEVIGMDAVCTEAMYNLGLVLKKMEEYEAALIWFDKLHAILRSSPEVIYQIADIYDKQGNSVQSLEWFNILISVVPTDPSILARLGDMFENEGDKSQAFQYYSESYRYYPSNMDVIAWLGAYYVDCEVYEQAIQFFERAMLIQPSEVKWQLMIASCYRRSGNYQAAFETYKNIHDKFPENTECLRFLVKICTDLGMKDVDEYKTKLARLEKGNLNRASNETISNAGVVPSEEEVVGSFGFHSSLTKKPSSLFAEENKLSSVLDF